LDQRKKEKEKEIQKHQIVYKITINKKINKSGKLKYVK